MLHLLKNSKKKVFRLKIKKIKLSPKSIEIKQFQFLQIKLSQNITEILALSKIIFSLNITADNILTYLQNTFR